MEYFSDNKIQGTIIFPIKYIIHISQKRVKQPKIYNKKLKKKKEEMQRFIGDMTLLNYGKKDIL